MYIMIRLNHNEKKLAELAEQIHRICLKMDCLNCPFYDDVEMRCKLSESPDTWQIKKILND